MGEQECVDTMEHYVPRSKFGLCHKLGEKLSYTELLSLLFFFLFSFCKACIRIKGNLKLLKIKQLMPFCQAGSNLSNLSHMLYSVTSFKCQP